LSIFSFLSEKKKEEKKGKDFNIFNDSREPFAIQSRKQIKYYMANKI